MSATTGPGSELTAPDATLVTLARHARGRAYAPHGGAVEGAAVRDDTGRNYAAATVGHADPELAVSALRGAVAAAVSSGARRFEAAVLVTTAAGPAAADLAFLAEFGGGVAVRVVDPSGAPAPVPGG